MATLALSKTANTYSRLALGIGVHDITAGYRAYRREVLEAIDLDTVDSKGYCFQIDLTWRTVATASSSSKCRSPSPSASSASPR